MKYSGIDLHSNNSVVVVSDETDRVMVEKRLPNAGIHRTSAAGARSGGMTGSAAQRIFSLARFAVNTSLPPQWVFIWIYGREWE